ncbi:DUF3016 domain-containing protein [Colwellia sp. 1_MG-2023]|uniref:DUF3016 domain-containing protein n=1 Tax=Colwellia sp. 1_MG-2023 TaxID=3062649 RepID=UPI0026E3C02E|nr:DUF3016 domain-containing protein [Colwellia sp. 1_MG-2023]MDO6447425.1 DUF3016 domain-containing protein [Colwellia sp. 1_MG-2023]
MFRKFLLAISCFFVITAHAGNSQIIWQSPENYADIYASIENKKTFQKDLFELFDNHFESLATQLPDGYSLYIKVNNLDLAGAISFANSRKIRVVDNTTPPRIEFDFQVIDQNNKVLISRGVYLWPKHFKFQRSLHANKPYYHELDLISEWFNNTFAPVIVKN